MVTTNTSRKNANARLRKPPAAPGWKQTAASQKKWHAWLLRKQNKTA